MKILRPEIAVYEGVWHGLRKWWRPGKINIGL